MSPLNLSKIVFLGIPLSLFDIKIDPIYQHLVGAKHRTKYDILVHTFPNSEEEISARKFPIPTDSIPYGKSCLGKDESSVKDEMQHI